MKGDLHIMVNFYPTFDFVKKIQPSFFVDGYRENGEMSYCGTPKMTLQYRLKFQLKEGVEHETAFLEITKGCNTRPW